MMLSESAELFYKTTAFYTKDLDDSNRGNDEMRKICWPQNMLLQTELKFMEAKGFPMDFRVLNSQNMLVKVINDISSGKAA